MKFLSIMIFFLTACSDSVLYNIKIREPDIIVHPSSIDFGHLLSGQESKTESILIINAGNEMLHIDSPFLYDPDERYTLGLESEFTLQPGEIIDISVGYIPTTYEENNAYVEIISDDVDENIIQVPIIGNGDAPIIRIDPLEFDYGTISIGCDNEARITIGNDGNLPLEVSNITQMVTQPSNIILEFGSLPEPPWLIGPGNELDFLVSYLPEDVGSDASEIIIESNDPLTPEVITSQEGVGDVEQWITDEYEQEEIPLIDLMWVIDDSGSMGTFQSHLSTNMQLFMNVFLSADPDYHMGYITTGTSFWEGGYFIDSTHADPALAAMSIINSIGVSGNANEMGIQMATNALIDTSVAGPGSSFWRDDAHLVVIFVSDEPDHSLSPLTDYITFFNGLKASDKLSIHAVIGDYPAGCQYYYNSYLRTAQFGSGYYDIVNYYGGNWYSICALDWGTQLQDLADAVTVARNFELTEADPIESTIKVYINGQETLEGWSYDALDNVIRFSEDSAPEAGQTINIEYATWGC